MVDFNKALLSLKAKKPLSEQEALTYKCRACPLSLVRNKPAYGAGNPLSRVAFVGESPNEDEDRSGELLKGQSGIAIRRMAETFGFYPNGSGLNTRNSFYYLNIVKCRSAETKTFDSGKLAAGGRLFNCPPSDEAITECGKRFLLRQLELLPNLELLIVLGATAAHGILGYQLGQLKMRNLRKRIFQTQFGVKAAFTYHPNYLIRNPHEKTRVYGDLQFAFSVLSGERVVEASSWKLADDPPSEYTQRTDSRPWKTMLPHQAEDEYSEELTPR